MMQASIHRRRSAQGSFVASFGLHAALLLLLLVAMSRSVASRFDEVDQLTQIAYIEAEYGEDVAAKVKLKTQPATPGPGIETRSAVKPKVDSPAPAIEKPSMADVSAPKLERADPSFTMPQTERLNSRASLQNAPAPSMPTTSRDAQALSGETSAPSLSSRERSATPALPQPGNALVSRGKSAVDTGGPTKPAPGSPRGDAAADAGGPAAPALSSRSGGSSYQAPQGSLSSSRERGGAIDAGAPTPGGGGSAGKSGRRTVLDYGSGGGGGGSLQGRGGQLAQAQKPDQPKSSTADAKQIQEAAPVELSNGMTISGQIAGRKILKSVPPQYTAQARKNGWEGVVAVHFTVLPDGRVKDNMYFEQTSAHRDLNQAAMTAIKQFQFAPLPAGQAAVEQWGVITIVFRLN